jgi:hypothetical protein
MLHDKKWMYYRATSCYYTCTSNDDIHENPEVPSESYCSTEQW